MKGSGKVQVHNIEIKYYFNQNSYVKRCPKGTCKNETMITTEKFSLPGSMPSVFGAPISGAMMVTFDTVMFLQS
jgi:hypothetical protein